MLEGWQVARVPHIHIAIALDKPLTQTSLVKAVLISTHCLREGRVFP